MLILWLSVHDRVIWKESLCILRLKMRILALFMVMLVIVPLRPSLLLISV